METKICQTCFKPKPVEKFKKTKTGNYKITCNDCVSEYQKAYQKKYNLENKERISNRQRERRLREGRKPRVIIKGKVKITCKVRDCNEPVVYLPQCSGYCKSHAFDIINPDV